MAKSSGWVSASKGKDKHGNKRTSGDQLFKDTPAQRKARRVSRRVSVTYREPVQIKKVEAKAAGPLHVDESPAVRMVETLVKDVAGERLCEGRQSHNPGICEHPHKIMDASDKRRRPSEATKFVGR